MYTVGQKLQGGFVNGYSIKTLENNVNEDRFDIKYCREHKPVISEYDHSYKTSSNEASQVIRENYETGKEGIFTKEYRLKAYPGHQPEYDIRPQHSYKTTYGEFTKFQTPQNDKK